MSIAIKVENLSKQYRLGKVGTGTISHDLNRWWHLVRGKEDPYLKIGETNDRSVKGNIDYVWALSDINFEIEQGSAVGIIGRNGAGKSTLLKILSRTTAPTTGSICMKGRVASLLEVGTGFHPELSGRENIYLNGAILGMSRREINRKFDEIVDFAGVERYIDTPVKRYSSGMYVRLAFAVAAHLESEILIVDEVLAVGDAEFQKKCLGKMSEVSKGDGRTVLFVSHNLNSIRRLCSVAALFNNGKLLQFKDVDAVLESYSKQSRSFYQSFPIINNFMIINSITLLGAKNNAIRQDQTLRFVIEFDLLNDYTNLTIKGLGFCLLLYNSSDELLSSINTYHAKNEYFLRPYAGKMKVEIEIYKHILNTGSYRLDMHINDLYGEVLLRFEKCLQFEITEDLARRGSHFSGSWPGPMSLMPNVFVSDLSLEN